MTKQQMTAASLASTAALFGREVFLTTFAGTDYIGKAVKIVGGLSSPAVLIVAHANGIGSPIGAHESSIPVQDIADIAADMGDGLTLVGAA